MPVRSIRNTLLAVFLLLFSLQPALAAHGKPRPDKTGILLVAFGSSVDEARASYGNVEAMVQQAFPGVPVRWAFTSHIVRDLVTKETGRRPDSPAMALARMAQEGFTSVAVQPLHVIPGIEFHELVRTCMAMQGLTDGPAHVSVGLPLLSTEHDLAQVAEALAAQYPLAEKEAVIFVGHGTAHPASVAYPAIQYDLWNVSPSYFVGTVEGMQDEDGIIARLKTLDVRTVRLVPLMAVAGDHAHNDIGGDSPDSWAGRMKAQGYDVQVKMSGLSSLDSVARLWVEHLHTAMSALPSPRQQQ
ncbi:anaerobic cobalt chelatase [Desulfovibrio sp. X2]|uniref:sirohydrochlorin cobaltochelatase n=1 Tax=Desulfovibrio sp. X2 TaxID=941449 RepID=UPI000358D32D|nr:sirohydrochlorin cobaltochelatase [Desulfovibrio sp. X2]EPR42411.1 anaerobic cobalt chelatase [Desulfovibrio sp. X2]